MFKVLNKVAVAMFAVAILLSGCAATAGTPSADPSALMSSALDAQAAGDNAQSKKLLEQILEVASPDDQPELVTTAYFNLGVLAQQVGDTNTSILNYKKALMIAPDYKPAMYNLAVIYTPIDTNAASTYYTLLLQVSPDDANVLYNFGLLKYANGKKSAGIDMLKQALEIAPSLKDKLPPDVKLS